jgi:hypothetical protein
LNDAVKGEAFMRKQTGFTRYTLRQHSHGWRELSGLAKVRHTLPKPASPPVASPAGKIKRKSDEDESSG